MYLEQVQGPSVQQSLNISAKLIASIKILQCSAEELEQSIAREMSENPALEVEEMSACLRCGSPLQAGICSACDRQNDGAAADTLVDTASWDEDLRSTGSDLTAMDELDYDPLDFVGAEGSLADYLLRQLGAILPDRDMPIAEYLVGSLNSHGYVTVTVEEAAETLRECPAEVERVLATLQSLDPPGIGARDLRECLLIQLRVFEERGECHSVASRVLDHYLHSLGEHHFLDIAREIGVTSTQVKQAWRFIRANLNPYPAHAFEAGDVPDMGLSTRSDRSVTIRPDVVIRRTQQGFEAEVIESRRFQFSVNGLYSSLYHQSRSHNLARGLNDHERQHIREYATRARFFMDCVRQRWETLSVISNALITYQYDFLDRGVRYLRPLTRGELADHVELHESTVSRATANKYVLLPNGRTIPFDDFFDGSLAAKDLLRELIAGENPTKPYSDEDLAALLKGRGLPLARRTVAKYREALSILPSRFRI